MYCDCCCPTRLKLDFTPHKKLQIKTEQTELEQNRHKKSKLRIEQTKGQTIHQHQNTKRKNTNE